MRGSIELALIVDKKMENRLRIISSKYQTEVLKVVKGIYFEERGEEEDKKSEGYNRE